MCVRNRKVSVGFNFTVVRNILGRLMNVFVGQLTLELISCNTVKRLYSPDLMMMVEDSLLEYNCTVPLSPPWPAVT